MKATEQYFPVVLFMVYKVVPSFESVNEILKCGIQLKGVENFLWCCLLPY